MTSLLRARLPRLYSRIKYRQIQTSALRRYDPAPIVRPETSSELEALRAKEKGPWTELTQEEKVTLYRAQFAKTLPESKEVEPYVVRLMAYLALCGALAVSMFAFMRKYIGPRKPRTLTDQWREDSIKKAKLQRSNPITGISSKS